MKVAWFQGDCQVPEDRYLGGDLAGYRSQDEINAAAPDADWTPTLDILLIPDDASLTDLRGDDWNDAPADCNAERPYEESLPEGSRWIRVRLGEQWPGDVT